MSYSGLMNDIEAYLANESGFGESILAGKLHDRLTAFRNTINDSRKLLVDDLGLSIIEQKAALGEILIEANNDK